jgi:succinate dehydrogenase / fumarate reductase, membrane anchor subunit
MSVTTQRSAPRRTDTSPNAKYRYGLPNRERFSWFFMRISGLFMFVTVLFHLLYMHMVVTVDNLTFDNIAERWTGPFGIWWRLFDASLLFLGMLHGYNGVRWNINDYVHNRFLNTTLKILLYITGTILIILGCMALIFGAGGVGRLFGLHD